MATSTVNYTGQLRTEAVHLESGTVIFTDAPKDNHGKGEAFSPTDLVATALASCMISIMGIAARKDDMTGVEGTRAEITKVMFTDPRRIGEVHVRIVFPQRNYTVREKKIYENAALTCPVAKSLNPEILQRVEFIWP